ncbi:tyrosine-type recombinase/integrase [Methylobrevis albus]|uniref:Site-specific integrase n=1 Tax=Methylobrevis albus TaxID=2793297 RepID=A0A931I2N0_9HYPH|nr:site-specific integrase [Methylobrevis albus]MBH0239115.1 site-specific integrase [Methylobrevis albus]
MATTLTAAALSNLRVPPDKRQIEVFDANTKGLSVIASAGGARAFFLTFTDPQTGKRARRKLGNFPEMSLATARARAREGRGQVADGATPLPPPPPAGITVAELVESYIERGMRDLRSKDAVARRLRVNLAAPSIAGRVAAASLSRADIARALDLMVDRGALAEANSLFRNIRSLVRWARGRGEITDDLTFGLKPPARSQVRERALSAEEVAAFWSGIEAPLRGSMVRLLRFTLATGARIGEVCGLRFDEIDADGVWHIPADRSKNKRGFALPLPSIALEILGEQRAYLATHYGRKDRSTGAPLVFAFPAPGGIEAIDHGAPSKALKRLQTNNGNKIGLPFGIQPFTPHDLRRTMATHLAIAGKNDFDVGLVLNHISTTRSSITSSVYIRHDYLSEKRTIMTLWDARLRELAGLPPPADPAGSS